MRGASHTAATREGLPVLGASEGCTAKSSTFCSRGMGSVACDVSVRDHMRRTPPASASSGDEGGAAGAAVIAPAADSTKPSAVATAPSGSAARARSLVLKPCSPTSARLDGKRSAGGGGTMPEVTAAAARTVAAAAGGEESDRDGSVSDDEDCRSGVHVGMCGGGPPCVGVECGVRGG